MKLTILMYHRVEDVPPGAAHRRNFVRPDQFASQLSALRRWGYSSIDFAEWLAHRTRRLRLPRRPLIITFDDGYRSVATEAWPRLRAHGFGATTFVVTDQIGGSNVWDADEQPQQLLSSDEILALRRDGMRFGSHSRTHRRLTPLSAGELAYELWSSRQALERLLGEPVHTLAYPFNSQNRVVRHAAREAGYRAAVRGAGRMNRRATDPLALRRIHVHEEMSLRTLRWRLFHARWLRL